MSKKNEQNQLLKIDFKEENQKSKISIYCNSLDQLNSLIDKLENKDV